MGLLDRIMTALLGPRCEHGCGHRVYRKPKDLAEHRAQYCTGAEGARSWS